MVEDADLLRSEIERCRQILARLSQRPDGNERDASDLPLPLSAVIENAAAPYHRRGVDLIIAPHGPEGPRIGLPLEAGVAPGIWVWVYSSLNPCCRGPAPPPILATATKAAGVSP